ncbi:hypothetical protein MMC17_006860 [Xylographa soralifera]|nr:hypothetical protein [Xylographa soralifera]MCJ1383746.1 hypothetical protein [Xylographa soralifera]
MPRPGLPPTPASSTDLQAKDHARASPFEMSFTLPPPAMTSVRSDRSSNVSIKSDSSYHPISPTLPAVKTTSNKQHRVSSTQKQELQQTAHADFSLPPPPTRSRKIIQMRPSHANTQLSTSPLSSKNADKKVALSPTNPSANKKQPSSTSIAGKKIARKTAHSLIERRRRSKMNEEFGVLKDMIPACHGQDMHKLAILQASIDYLRYLEQCVTDLKAVNSTLPTSAHYQSQPPTPRAMSSASPTNHDDSEDDEDEDLEMQDRTSADVSPGIASMPSRESLTEGYCSSVTSPAIMLSRGGTHNSSYTSISSLPSPAFSARSHQQSYQHAYRSTDSHSNEVSPAITANSMQDADHEATAALLMLNTDRRYLRVGKTSGRGMSVQDLLSA